MKMYKVEFQYSETGCRCARYYEHRKDAIAAKESYKGYKAHIASNRVEVKYHHRALAKGYICKDCTYQEEYDGRFGVGYRLHIENCRERVSNSYHYVEYYIEQR